uniref:Multiple C2 and transmembrane domain-containing protein 1 n=1 Tax=Cacopsylla melanoneura TaxID=428564 RepID=A0A8D8VPG9_9HEMI
MGSASLDLTTLELGRCMDLVLSLEDPSKPEENLGEIYIAATLYPRSQEDKEQYFQRNNKTLELTKRLKNQIWSSVVTIVLIKGKNLLPMDPEGTSDPYVRFKLGNEKYKSKVIYKELNPRWLEQFDLHMYDDQSQELELTVMDKDRSKDDLLGRCTIDLSTLERETTHKISKTLEDGGGTISLLLTISGTTASETITDLTSHSEHPQDLQMIQERYSLFRAFHRLRDVGHLTVKVYKATGLAAADLGGKSDPFCVLELVNARLQTQTEYKTLTPVWNKIFTFNVKDINSVLDVTVYDEDKDHKVEFLGKLAIPLLRILNGEKKWYALKDKKLMGRAKGNNPQILLEMNVVWNTVRACIRTLNPMEKKYMQTDCKFKRQVFVQNVMRLKAIVTWLYDIGLFLQDCFEWESRLKSLIGVIIFTILCYYFEPYMVPIALLLIFLRGYVVQTLLSSHSTDRADDDDVSVEDEDEDDDKDKEEKKSLKEKLQAVQEVTQYVQNAIGNIASLCESVKK